MSDPEPKAAGNRGKGRVKGVPNKMTMQAKEAIAAAAEGLGGTARLIAWAQESPENERVFWASIYTRLVPVVVNGTHDVNVVDQTELLQRARDEVRSIFGERGAGEGDGFGGGGLPH
jgi:hypothetical protein